MLLPIHELISAANIGQRVGTILQQALIWQASFWYLILEVNTLYMANHNNIYGRFSIGITDK